MGDNGCSGDGTLSRRHFRPERDDLPHRGSVARTAVLGTCASAAGDSDVARVSMSAWWARPPERPDPEGHCWRHPQRFMRAAAIVERDVQADCSEMAIQFLDKA